ncbi:MAG: excinuclease ABC subunit UvrC [Hyphomonadaceae bacterium]
MASSADHPPLPDLAELPPDAAVEAPAARLRGAEVIRDYLKRLPPRPGVYRMLGAEGEVLYVGKAKSLKARVSQYAQGRGHDNRIMRMIALTEGMEFVVTATETEALLLEANLIKRLRPRFNVLMRDDKSFAMIAIRTDHLAPPIQKHRGAKNFKGEYYGPFASAGAVNRTLNTLQKAFLLRSCSDSVYSSRTRPCMLYQIKRCAAPCTGLIELDEYAKLVDEAKAFLKGRSAELQDRLAEEMQEAAGAMRFEHAARLRDRIRALAAIRAAQGVNPQTFEEADVFAMHMEGGQSCVQVFFFRAHQNWGNRAYFPRHERDASEGDVLDAFIAQFYDDKTPPSLVMTSHELPEGPLLEAALSLKAEHRVEVSAPQRGEKREIMNQAVLNAREALGRRVAEGASVARLLDGVAEAFGLPEPPERIEIYDNSHIQGTNAIGAFVVAGPEGFVKNQYRKYNIRSVDLTPGDDYAMMREVLKRRFTRLLRESGEGGEEQDAAEQGAILPFDGGDVAEGDGGGGPPRSSLREGSSPVKGEQGARPARVRRPRPNEDGGVDFSKDERTAAWPDLVLIDGGEGQLQAVLETMAELGLSPKDVPIVGIAKGVDRDAGRERFFMPGKTPFRMPEKSPVLFYLQRLRDEAHRFAIGVHRAKRKQEMARNPLDEIEGVGPSRKRALLNRFGSARGVSRAALAELRGVEGVNEALAQRIFDHFRK